MPTILHVMGWRFYFYANEGDEPIHIHAAKGDMRCKFWLDTENFDVTEAWTRAMNPRDKRRVKRIIIDNFEYIEREWKRFQRRRYGEE